MQLITATALDVSIAAILIVALILLLALPFLKIRADAEDRKNVTRLSDRWFVQPLSLKDTLLFSAYLRKTTNINGGYRE